MDPELVEKLHEKASSAYLQGDVEGALSAWREVLAANPSDERALEGVQLCERMSGCESASVVTDGQSPFAVGQSAQAPASSPTEDDDADLGDPLDELLDMGEPPPPSPAREEEPEPAKPDFGGLFDLSEFRDDSKPEDQSEELDIGEILGSPSDPVPGRDSKLPESLFDDDDIPPVPDDPHYEPESTWQFGVVPETLDPPLTEQDAHPSAEEHVPDPAPWDEEMSFGHPEPPPVEAPPSDPGEGPFVEAPPEVNSGDAAAAGLHRRASELLTTALAEMERGDRDSALATLDRLLILDEHNEAARSLKAKLASELGAEATGQETDASASDVPDPGKSYGQLEMQDGGGESLGLDLGETVEGESSPGSATELPGVAAAAEKDRPESLDDLFDAGGATGEPRAAAPRRRFALPISRKIWFPAAAVLVLGLGFVGWQIFLGGAEASDEDLPPVSRAERPEQRPPKQDPPPEPAPAPVEVVKTTEEKIAEFLEQADASMAEADYAAAILSLDEVLKLDPENPDHLARLESAAESYRIQQAKQERWNQAVEDFDAGDYRAALAYFYRLPEDEKTERIDHYMRNGWYNLGVVALKNRECEEALDHLGEARRLDAADPGVLQATDLAMRCRRDGLEVIQASVASLDYRGLEDSP